MIAHRRNLLQRILLISLTLLLLFLIYAPILWLFISSISTRAELLAVPPHWIPTQVTFANYANILFGGPDAPPAAREFLYAMGNSLVVASAVTLISLVVGTMAAYAFARIRFPGTNVLLVAVLGTRMLPGLSIVIPLYIIASARGLLDTRTVLVLLYLSFTLPFVIWIMISFFRTIPLELEEAARIDGCSRIGAMLRIILPISGPGLVSTTIFAFLLAWDEFFIALLFTSRDAKTVPVAIAEFTGRYAVDYTAMATAGVLAAIPPIVLAIVFQRYIVSGLTSGAVKG